MAHLLRYRTRATSPITAPARMTALQLFTLAILATIMLFWAGYTTGRDHAYLECVDLEAYQLDVAEGGQR